MDDLIVGSSKKEQHLFDLRSLSEAQRQRTASQQEEMSVGTIIAYVPYMEDAPTSLLSGNAYEAMKLVQLNHEHV